MRVFIPNTRLLSRSMNIITPSPRATGNYPFSDHAEFRVSVATSCIVISCKFAEKFETKSESGRKSDRLPKYHEDRVGGPL